MSGAHGAALCFDLWVKGGRDKGGACKVLTSPFLERKKKRWALVEEKGPAEVTGTQKKGKGGFAAYVPTEKKGELRGEGEIQCACAGFPQTSAFWGGRKRGLSQLSLIER